jgi:hypothetical protein
MLVRSSLSQDGILLAFCGDCEARSKQGYEEKKAISKAEIFLDDTRRERMISWGQGKETEEFQKLPRRQRRREGNIG